MADELVALTKKQEEAIKRIKVVCERVEKSQDEYKKCVADICKLQQEKVHEGSGLTFHEYIHERTGIGRTTCTYLLRIGKYISNTEMNKAEEKAFMELPMRTILETIANDRNGEAMKERLEAHDSQTEATDYVSAEVESLNLANSAVTDKRSEPVYIVENAEQDEALAAINDYICESADSLITIKATKNGLTVIFKEKITLNI